MDFIDRMNLEGNQARDVRTYELEAAPRCGSQVFFLMLAFGGGGVDDLSVGASQLTSSMEWKSEGNQTLGMKTDEIYRFCCMSKTAGWRVDDLSCRV